MSSQTFADNDSSAKKNERDNNQLIIGGEGDEAVSLYQLSYAVIGSDTAKTLISVKFRPFVEKSFYLAYANLLLWDIYKNSSPYKDINFIIEAFYRYIPDSGAIKAIDMGYLHTSNGKDEEESRAWERAFIRFNLGHESEDMTLIGASNFYMSLRTGSNNGDINDYIGFWDLSIVLKPKSYDLLRNLDIQWTYTSGDNGNPFRNGSHMVGMAYGFNKWRIRPYLYLQYFVGYGETMIDYNKSSEEVRAGFAFHY